MPEMATGLCCLFILPKKAQGVRGGGGAQAGGGAQLLSIWALVPQQCQAQGEPWPQRPDQPPTAMRGRDPSQPRFKGQDGFNHLLPSWPEANYPD